MLELFAAVLAVRVSLHVHCLILNLIADSGRGSSPTTPFLRRFTGQGKGVNFEGLA